MRIFNAKRILAVVLALAMLVGALVSCNKEPENPIDFLRKGVENSISALAIETIGNTGSKNTSSIEINVDFDKLDFLDDMMLGLGDLGLNANLKLYADSQGDSVAVEANAGAMGITMLSALACIDAEKVAAKASIIGNKAYGLKFDEIADKFDDSVFGPDGEYSIGLSAEEIDWQLNIEEATALNSLQMLADAGVVLDELFDVFYGALEEHGESSKEDGTLTFTDAEVTTTNVTVKLSAISALSVAEDILEYIHSSENFTRLVGNYYESANSAYNYYMYNVDKRVSEFKDMIGEELEAIRERKEELTEEDGGIILTFNISKEKGELIGVNVLTETDEPQEFKLLFGPDIAQLNEIKYEAEYSENDTEAYVIKLDKSDTDEMSAFDITITETYKYEEFGDTLTYKAGIEIDKVSGESAVFYKDDYEEISLGFTIEHEEDTYKITLGKFESYVLESPVLSTYLHGITIVLDESAEMPKIDEYENVLDMSADEVEKLVDTFESLFGAILG